jgi:hypothetical protein
MNRIDLSKLVPRMVLWLNDTAERSQPSIYISVPSAIPCFDWPDHSLEILLRKLLVSAMSVGESRKRIRLEVCEKSKMRGFETFFSVSALRWIQCSLLFQTQFRFEAAARTIMNSLGYRCIEWIGGDNTEGQLGAYSRIRVRQPEVVLYIAQRDFPVQCDLFIPVIERRADFSDNVRPEVHRGKMEVTDSFAL